MIETYPAIIQTWQPSIQTYPAIIQTWQPNVQTLQLAMQKKLKGIHHHVKIDACSTISTNLSIDSIQHFNENIIDNHIIAVIACHWCY